MRIIQMNPDCSNVIGKAGENLAVQARFPVVESFRAQYGEGTFVLCLQSNEDTEPYAAEVCTDGADVCWNVTAVDTQQPGFAAAELRYYAGDVLAKSVRYRLFVEPSVGEPSAEPPAPMQDWISEWMEAKEKIGAFLQASEGGTQSQTGAEAGEREQYRTLLDYTVSEDDGIAQIEITQDSSGNSFAFKKLRIKTLGPVSAKRFDVIIQQRNTNAEDGSISYINISNCFNSMLSNRDVFHQSDLEYKGNHIWAIQYGTSLRERIYCDIPSTISSQTFAGGTFYFAHDGIGYLRLLINGGVFEKNCRIIVEGVNA